MPRPRRVIPASNVEIQQDIDRMTRFLDPDHDITHDPSLNEMIAHDGDSFIIPTRFVEVESVVEEEIISSDSESENIDIINFKERPEKKDEPNDEEK